MGEYKKWPARELVNSSFIWQRSDKNYSCLGGSSVIKGLFYYCQQKGIANETFGRSIAKVIEDYFREMNIEPKSNIVENNCKKHHDVFRGTMLIESIGKDETTRHMLRVSDVVDKNSSNERKMQSLRNMNLICSCKGAHFQTLLTIPAYLRTVGDNRETDSLPSPQIINAIDTHGATGMDWLVEEEGAEGHGIFGLNNHTIEIAKNLAESTLSNRLSEYEINTFLRDKTILFKPLEERLEI